MVKTETRNSSEDSRREILKTSIIKKAERILGDKGRKCYYDPYSVGELYFPVELVKAWKSSPYPLDDVDWAELTVYTRSEKWGRNTNPHDLHDGTQVMIKVGAGKTYDQGCYFTIREDKDGKMQLGYSKKGEGIDRVNNKSREATSEELELFDKAMGNALSNKGEPYLFDQEERKSELKESILRKAEILVGSDVDVIWPPEKTNINIEVDPISIDDSHTVFGQPDRSTKISVYSYLEDSMYRMDEATGVPIKTEIHASIKLKEKVSVVFELHELKTGEMRLDSWLDDFTRKMPIFKDGFKRPASLRDLQIFDELLNSAVLKVLGQLPWENSKAFSERDSFK